MMRTLTRGLLVVLGAGLTAVGVLVAGVRTKYPPVLGFVTRTLRDRANPATMATAGAPGQSNGVIVHVGRRSGRTLRTPVTPQPTDDGFVIALPYGPDSDWVRNVLAAGSATLVTNGEDVPVDRPEIRPFDDFAARLPTAARLGTRLMGVSSCLVLHRI